MVCAVLVALSTTPTLGGDVLGDELSCPDCCVAEAPLSGPMPAAISTLLSCWFADVSAPLSDVTTLEGGVALKVSSSESGMSTEDVVEGVESKVVLEGMKVVLRYRGIMFGLCTS